MSRKLFLFISTIFLSAVLSGAVFGFDSQDTVSLALNAPVSRDFKDGAKHGYTVSARENEIIEISCERRGVNVSLAAFAPDGTKISLSNAPGGFAGFDRLLFIAEKMGEYRVEIDSRRPGNSAGSYTILLKARRGAT